MGLGTSVMGVLKRNLQAMLLLIDLVLKITENMRRRGEAMIWHKLNVVSRSLRSALDFEEAVV